MGNGEPQSPDFSFYVCVRVWYVDTIRHGRDFRDKTVRVLF